jgi:hypothetical protein
MNPEQSSLLDTALKLGLPVEGTKQSLLTQVEIASRLGQNAPYLAVRHALLCQKDGEHGLLAEVWFGPETCAGHYPGSPSIPLVDMGRAMDQAAAISFNGHVGVPMLKRISKLRAESMEVARPDSAYWIWATKENGALVTRLYSSVSGKILATIQGWEYVFASAPSASLNPQFAGLTNLPTAVEIEWLTPIQRDQIVKHIPQTPPFLVLQSGRRGRTSAGAEAVQTISRFRVEEVSGHLGGANLLGPMHYARSLAQSGMLLSSLVGNAGTAVPEVVSAKTIWHDTREYFGPEVEIVTTVICDRTFNRGGLSFVTLNGVVSVQGKPVLGTDSFVYVLIPSAQHPSKQASLHER